MGKFGDYLRENIGIHPSMTSGHIRVYKSGKIVQVDPFLTLKKVSKEGTTEIHFEKGHDPIKIKNLMDALTNPGISPKLKHIILRHIEVNYSDRVKYAKIETKDGKLILTVNPKYLHKKKKVAKKLDK